ncbi:MAG: glycosyltransferase [Paramuribaculum sp.]|nr:glycosyltransferase [Paramuribaculum sp.]
MKPLFSIITVTFNASSTLSPTLKSVGEQSFTDFEHLIIDGASSDNTVDIAQASAVPEKTKIFSEPDFGLYDAMNKGIDKATGEYLIFLNAGDTFHSADSLQKISDTIKANDCPGIVYGQTAIVDSNRNIIADRHLIAPEKLEYKSFKQGMVVCHQAFVVLARIAPMYDMRYRFSSDYDWCIKCLQHSRHNVYVGDTTIDFLYEGLTSKNRKKSLIERFKIMSKYYGFIPTFVNHIRFIPRFISRRREENKLLQH